MDGGKFSWKKRVKSFAYAFAGVRRLIRREHNARIHCAAAVAAVALGLWLRISPSEWMAVAICIGGVFAAEAFNSAIEALADRVSAGYDEAIKHTKDLAAGAVLFMAAAALAVGLIVFLPKLTAFFRTW